MDIASVFSSPTSVFIYYFCFCFAQHIQLKRSKTPSAFPHSIWRRLAQPPSHPPQNTGPFVDVVRSTSDVFWVVVEFLCNAYLAGCYAKYKITNSHRYVAGVSLKDVEQKWLLSELDFSCGHCRSKVWILKYVPCKWIIQKWNIHIFPFGHTFNTLFVRR